MWALDLFSVNLPDRKDIQVPGPKLTTLPPHLTFVTGLRLTQKGSNYCGASLISRNFVLTATHCVEGDNAPVWVSIGSLLKKGGDEGEQIQVLKVTIHPAYDRAKGANDLAVIQLKYPSVQSPVILFTSPHLPDSGMVLGFSAMGSNPVDGQFVPSDELRYVYLDLIAKKGKCKQLLGQPVDDSTFCAGGGEVNKDACTGDSGGARGRHQLRQRFLWRRWVPRCVRECNKSRAFRSKVRPGGQVDVGFG